MHTNLGRFFHCCIIRMANGRAFLWNKLEYIANKLYFLLSLFFYFPGWQPAWLLPSNSDRLWASAVPAFYALHGGEWSAKFLSCEGRLCLLTLFSLFFKFQDSVWLLTNEKSANVSKHLHQMSQWQIATLDSLSKCFGLSKWQTEKLKSISKCFKKSSDICLKMFPYVNPNQGAGQRSKDSEPARKLQPIWPECKHVPELLTWLWWL